MLTFLATYIGPAATGLEPWSLALAGAALAFGYTVFGLTGFGSAIVAMPLLTQLLPLRTATPIMLVCDMTAGLLLGFNNRGSIDRRELRRILPWMVGGLLAGLALLMYVPQRPLLLLLGFGVLFYSVWRLLSPNTFRPLSPGWAIPLGLSGGSFTALFGTGGPLYTIYLAGRIEDRQQLRATISTLILCSGIGRLVLFGSAGLFGNPAIPALLAWLLPCCLIGVRLGAWLRTRISPTHIGRALWSILIIGSLSLIAKSI